MSIDKDSIRIALSRVPHPSAGMSIVDAGAVSKVSYCDGFASIRVAAGGLHDDHKRGLRQQIGAAVRLHAQQAKVEMTEVHIELTDDPPQLIGTDGKKVAGTPTTLTTPVPGSAPTSQFQRPTAPPRASAPAQPKPQTLPGVKHIIAVGAGKGGVGKSTVSVNLAVGLARRGYAVGLMDGDIYGPSLPTMLGLASLETNVRGSMIEPFYVHGVKAMTIGKLVDPEKPLIWRGPMAHGAFKQLCEQTSWGELDYLIIDLPPGTGDVSLTMAQLLKLTGAVIVCTPQKVAQDDCVRAARMFQQLQIEVLGVVENMSYFVGDDGKEYDLFGRGGAQMMAQRLGLPFLGSVPITTALRLNSDSGDASANFGPSAGMLGPALERLVEQLEGQVSLASLKQGQRLPTLSIH
jgi:ATP-binding protein involved in chromosome partitioning